MIYKEANTAVLSHFNDGYFNLHQFLLSEGDAVGSRNGSTRELLNFKTVIKNPVKRCVGGYDRNINVFFLLAEAIWIWAGRRDVAFLDTFNSQLKNYSDDGINYHAPYGWRMRNFGVSSDNSITEENKHFINQGVDQIQAAINMLYNNPEDRRVVLSIWNPEEDLGRTSKDIPCNDLVMFKIRNGLLYTTIANRSNDLNLGLTTNAFQFSFVSEIVSKILNIGLGDQVHNSQSLHLYLNNDMTHELFSNISKSTKRLLYEDAETVGMDFSFTDVVLPTEKLSMVDFHINSVISLLNKRAKSGNKEIVEYEDSLKSFSRYFYYVYKLLAVYVDYKINKDKTLSIRTIIELGTELPEFAHSDYQLLALNFFVTRVLKSKYTVTDKEAIDIVKNQHRYGDLGTF